MNILYIIEVITFNVILIFAFGHLFYYGKP